MAVVPEDEMVDALVEWAELHRRARRRGGAGPRRHARRPREAEADRAALLDEQGADANHAGERVDLIRKLEKP